MGGVALVRGAMGEGEGVVAAVVEGGDLGIMGMGREEVEVEVMGCESFFFSFCSSFMMIWSLMKLILNH